MKVKTTQLIRELANDAKPVRSVARPYTRAVIWLALSIAYVVVLLLVIPIDNDASLQFRDDLFIVEQVAASATAISAAFVAFTSGIPGYSHRWTKLPLLPLGVWLVTLGPGCVKELNQSGIQHLPLGHDPWCVPFILLFGAVPALAIVIMLRRGAPLAPYTTAAFGGLAAAGLGNVGVRMIHPEDVSLMLLVWHVGSVLALSAFAGAAGRYFFNWHSLINKSRFRT
jgi:hypothetical protein